MYRSFDDLMATLPVPPLPPGLPPNLLGPSEPDSESKPSSSSSSKKKKKKKLKTREDVDDDEDESTMAAKSRSAERSDVDVVGDGSDWSIEALEAYLVSQLQKQNHSLLVDYEGAETNCPSEQAALEKRAEQAEAAPAAA